MTGRIGNEAALLAASRSPGRPNGEEDVGQTGLLLPKRVKNPLPAQKQPGPAYLPVSTWKKLFQNYWLSCGKATALFLASRSGTLCNWPRRWLYLLFCCFPISRNKLQHFS